MPEISWSESDYRAGLQCDLRLWRARNLEGRGVAPDHDSHLADLDRAELMRALGSLLEPGENLAGGTVRHEDLAAWRCSAIDKRRAWLDVRIEHGDTTARLDALERVEPTAGPSGELDAVSDPPMALRLYVLESRRMTRESDYDRAAFQYRLLRQMTSRAVVSVQLIGPDPRYVRGTARSMWRRREITADVELLAHDVASELVRGRELVAGPRPGVEPSPHCRNPEPCPFLSDCERALEFGAVARLPRLDRTLFHALRERGIEQISEIPRDVKLSALQERARRAHDADRAFHGPGLRAALAPLGPPTAYLDFEYVSSALPWLDGMRPYEPVPYQWSLHCVDASGSIAQRAFLADVGREDPRRAFAESLVHALGDEEMPIVVYSPSEGEIVEALAAALLDLREPLRAIRRRLADLQAVLVNHVYHPGFGGSFALKRVTALLNAGLGPAAQPLGEVTSGAEAATALRELATPGLFPERRASLRSALLAYCERDTRILLELHHHLRTTLAPIPR